MNARLALALVVVCLAYALTACGGGEEPFEETNERRGIQPVQCEANPEVCR